MSLICLILGILLLVVAGILFFRLGVKDAWNFIHNKHTGKPTRTSSSSNRRRKSSKTTKGKTSDDSRSKFSGKKIEHSGWGVSGGSSGKPANTGDVVKSNAPDQSVSSEKVSSEGDTSLLEESSEAETGLLETESEAPTGILADDSEKPTGILDEDTESPTGILQEDDSENATELLHDDEDSEKPTDVLAGDEDSEAPTGILSDDSESPTGVFDEEAPIKSKDDYDDSFEDSDFMFKLVKNEVVVHTDEEIN